MFNLWKVAAIGITGAILFFTGCAEKSYYAQVHPESFPNVQSLKVAIFSPCVENGNIDLNLKHFENLIIKAKKQNARLMCFPEGSLTGYSLSKPSFHTFAQQVPGPATAKLAEIAAKYNVYISARLFEKDGDAYYICQALVGPKGYIGKYRKHCPTKDERAAGISAGKDFPIFDVEGFAVGINICADSGSDETIEAMRLASVDIVLHPHANGPRHGGNAEIWTRGRMCRFVERAVYSRSYILINNLASKNPRDRGFSSGALVIDPMGQVIARTTQKDNTEKTLYATVYKPIDAIVPQFELEKIHRHIGLRTKTRSQDEKQ